MFWEVLVSSKLLVAYRVYVQSSSCSLSSLSSAFFSPSWKLNLIFYSRVLKFLCSGAFLAVLIFLSAVSSLIRGHLLFRRSSFHHGISGPFSSKWDWLSFAAHRRLLPSSYYVGFYWNNGHFCVLPRHEPDNLQGHCTISVFLGQMSRLYYTRFQSVFGVHGFRVLRPQESHIIAQFFCCPLVG